MRSITFKDRKRKTPGISNRRRQVEGRNGCSCQNSKVQRFLRKRQNDGSPDRLEVKKPLENSVANKDFCIMERMKEVVSKAENLDMYDKMMFIAAIDQEAKGNPFFLDAILLNPTKLKMALVFIPPLVQSIRERNLKRFEMAFSIKE